MSDQLGKHTSRVKFLQYKAKYLLYGVSGGIYFSSMFDRQTRRIWYGISAIAVCTFVGLEIFYVRSIFMGNEGYADISSVIFLHAATLGLPMCVLLAYIEYYFRREQEWGLKQNENRPEQMNYLKGRTDSKNIKKVVLYIYIICNIQHACLMIGHIIIAVCTAAGPEELREPEWQFMPNPFAAFIEAEAEFVGLTICLFLSYLILMYVALCHALFSLALAREYHRSAAHLWSRIERFSEASTIAFENLNERFLNKDIQVSDYLLNLQIERERMIRKIKSASRVYQQHIKQIQRILPYLEITFAGKIICTYCCFVMLMTAIHSDAFPLIQKWKGLCCLISIYTTWFCDCYAGEIFFNLGETTLEKVQDIPWYYLDPTRRKVYYIFLCMAQRPIEVKALGLCEAGRPMYMKLMKMSYTYYNFLRSRK